MQNLGLRFGISLVVISLVLLLTGVYFSVVGSTVTVDDLINGFQNNGTSVHIETTDGKNPLPIDYIIKGSGNSSNDNPTSDENNSNDNSSSSSSDNSNGNGNGNGNITSSNNGKSTGGSSGNSTTSNQGNGDNNANNGNETTSGGESGSTEQPSSPTPNPITEQNVLSLKNNIESTYNITITYGSEISNYSVGGYGVIITQDINTIYNSLVVLQNCLSVYPNGFFSEMNNGGLPLTIYLIQSFASINNGNATPVNITGITHKTKSKAIISIAVNYPIKDTFHHENFHYLEHYMNLKGGYFTNWNNYNPSNFTYGNYDKSTVYDVTFSPYAYFVNTYAQSYEYEDRACTFEYMMADAKISALNNGNNIWKKAKVMSDMIDYYFSTVNANTIEYWERFL